MEEKDSVCVWGKIKIGPGRHFWESSCDKEWDHSIADFRFCPFCGRRINILRAPKESEE